MQSGDRANRTWQVIMRSKANRGAAPDAASQLERGFRVNRMVAIFGVAMLLAACEGASSVTPIATEPDVVTAKLEAAADKASRALDTIANIEQARSPATPPADSLSDAPPNLAQPISVRWSGPIDQITKALADRAGMRFRVKGTIPPVPVTVSVDIYQEPLIHVLQNIGLQAGQRADLSVDAQNGVVEIRYAPPDRI